MQILENMQIAAALALAIFAAIMSGNPAERTAVSHYFSQAFAVQAADLSPTIDPSHYTADGWKAESITGTD